VVDWLAQAQATAGGWEKLVDDRLAPLLIPHLPAAGEPYATDGGESKVITPLVLQVRDGTIAVVERPAR
jgi:hypothetical protein